MAIEAVLGSAGHKSYIREAACRAIRDAIKGVLYSTISMALV